MSPLPLPLEELIGKLTQFPGIGPKSAERMAFTLLHRGAGFCQELLLALENFRDRLRYCDLCGHLAEGTRCPICLDPGRSGALICVVEEIRDILAIEKTGDFHGHYHVLGGVIAPIRGIRPENLRITGLVERLQKTMPAVEEVILALNPTLEGETTALYLKNILAGSGVLISQIIYGVPLGGELEFTDKLTLSHSFRARRPLTGGRPRGVEEKREGAV